jgi:hypothetical protein
MRQFIILFFLISLSLFKVRSQPLIQRSTNPDFFSEESAIYQPKNKFHTSVRPFLNDEINKIILADSSKNNLEIKSAYNPGLKIWNKLLNEDLIEINGDDYSFKVNPLINFEISNDFKNDDRAWVNTRGVMVDGNIGPRFAFATRFYENQATFVDYIDKEIQNIRVIPGQGGYKGYKTDGYDFSRAEGYISYSPNNYFNFRFGHGRNFFGDGYRSLLLGDAHFPYPYFLISTTVWRIKYINLYAEFMERQSPREESDPFRKKYGTFHYLTINITPRLKLGLFEAIIWKAHDSTGYRGFDFNYLNPVIFYRPVEFSVGSPDNALMGINASYTIGNYTTFYGQLLLDEFKIHEVFSGNRWWGNKQAVQLGVRVFNILGIHGLNIQAEGNIIRPYTYSHWESIQNYGHYSQPLAHPMGANLKEGLFFLRYHKARWHVNYQFQYALYGLDTNNVSFGKNIFRSYNSRPFDYGVIIGQGLRTNLWRQELKISWMLNPNYNLNLSTGIVWRKESNIQEKNDLLMFYVSLSTALEKLYYDF